MLKRPEVLEWNSNHGQKIQIQIRSWHLQNLRISWNLCFRWAVLRVHGESNYEIIFTIELMLVISTEFNFTTWGQNFENKFR